MSRHTRRNRPRLATAALILPACLALAACGSSSSPSGSSSAKGGASASSTTAGGSSSTTSTSGASGSGKSGSSKGDSSKSAAGAGVAGAGLLARTRRLMRLRACLARNGVTLPDSTPAERFGFGLLGGLPPALPKGVTRAQYEAALNKCGGGLLRPGALKGLKGLKGFKGLKGLKALQGSRSSAVRAAFSRFAACMRANGVALPAPNTSGKGPIFNTKGVNVASPQFRAAEAKCAPLLRFGLLPPAQAGAGGSGSRAPNAGAGF